MRININSLLKPVGSVLLIAAGAIFAQQSIAQAEATPKTLRPGVLTVGSDLTYPPYYSTKNGQAVGFGPKMVRALADQMGLDAHFQNTKFAQLVVQLKAHRFDIVASALYITPERAKQVDYVPLFQTGNSVIVRGGGDFKPKQGTDLCGHKVSVIKGASVIPKLLADAKKGCTNGQSIDIDQYPTAPEATQALLSRAADAQIVDAAVSKQIVNKTGTRIVISTDEVLYPVPVGLGVTKGNDQLKSALESALAKLREDGSYQRLLSEYNLRAPDPDLLESALGNQ